MIQIRNIILCVFILFGQCCSAEFVDFEYRKGLKTLKYETPLAADIKEWQRSAIHKDLIDLNLISLPEFVLDENKKIVAVPFLDLMELPYQRFRDFYSVKINKHQRRIWTYVAYDINLANSDFHEYKISDQYRNKYEHDSDKPRLKLAKVSFRMAKKILPNEYEAISDSDLSLEAKDFWHKIFNSKQAIVLTEGHKKALSLLSNGIAAISVTPNCLGLYSYYENNELKLGISEDLKKLFSYKKRTFYFHFDSDDFDPLREFVFSAKLFLAKIAKSYKHKVKIIVIENSKYKACDDIIRIQGFKAFEVFYKNALSIKEFEKKYPIQISDYFDKYKEDGEHYKWCFDYEDGPDYLRKEIFKDEDLNNLTKKKFANGVNTFVFKRPRQKHVQEWKESAISNELINLNLISIPDIVLSSKKEFISYPFLDLMDLHDTDFLRKHNISKSKSERELWTYTGYKLSNPVLLQDVFDVKVAPKDKVYSSKYEHSGSEATSTLPHVSGRVAKMIFPDRYKSIADEEEALDFWQNVFASNKPIVLTEGHKKALSLLSHGVIAFSIHQKCVGLSLYDDEKLDIAKDLREFLEQDKKRLFFISFDTDINPYARKHVMSSVYFIAKQIKKTGHKVKIVVIPENSGKGADDFIVKKGFAAYQDLMKKALSIKNFKKQFKEMILDKKEMIKEYSWCLKDTKGYWHD
jgi:hypothetical protein